MRGTGVAIGIILATGALVTVLGYAAIIVGGRHL